MNEYYYFDPLFDPSSHGAGVRAGDGPAAVARASTGTARKDEDEGQPMEAMEEVREQHLYRYDYALRLKHNLLLVGAVLYVYFRYRRGRDERDRRAVRFSGVVGGGRPEEERRRCGGGQRRDWHKEDNNCPAPVAPSIRRCRPTGGGGCDDPSFDGSGSFLGTKGHGKVPRRKVVAEDEQFDAGRKIRAVSQRPSPLGSSLSNDAPTMDVDDTEDSKSDVPLVCSATAHDEEQRAKSPSRETEDESASAGGDGNKHGRSDERGADDYERVAPAVGRGSHTPDAKVVVAQRREEGDGDGSDISDWTVIDDDEPPTTGACGGTGAAPGDVPPPPASAGRRRCPEELTGQTVQRRTVRSEGYVVGPVDLSAFHAWHREICSSYRIVSIGQRKGDGETEIYTPPVQRAYELCATPVVLRIKNGMHPLTINVFEISPALKESHVASIAPGATWTHRTFIGRPIILRTRGNGTPLLYHVVLRIVPTTLRAPTIDDVRHPGVGVSDMTLLPLGNPSEFGGTCRVLDSVLPHPSTEITTVPDAVEWCCRQHEREGASPDLLLRYLCNALRHPTEERYRRIRTANPAFREGVWNGPGRGVLLALGFREVGDHVELGLGSSSPGDSTAVPPPLSDGQMKDISDAAFRLARCKSDMASGVVARRQPQGVRETR